MSKKLIIGIAAGVAAVGGVAALIIRHYKKQEEEILDCLDECSRQLAESWDDDCDDACISSERCCDIAEMISRKQEEEARRYGK